MEPQSTEEGARSAARLIEQLADGEAQMVLSQELHRVCVELRDESESRRAKVSGTVSLTLKISAEGGMVDAAYMADVSEDWEEVWETERVFFTREEADAYGNGRAYNYPEGWRSYSVPAMGELRDLVRMLTTRAPDPREPRP